jgi:hypothetical protein
MSTFMVGARVKPADIRPDSIRAYANMRGTVTEVRPDGRIIVRWDCDAVPEGFYARDPRTVVLAGSDQVTTGAKVMAKRPRRGYADLAAVPPPSVKALRGVADYLMDEAAQWAGDPNMAATARESLLVAAGLYRHVEQVTGRRVTCWHPALLKKAGQS